MIRINGNKIVFLLYNVLNKSSKSLLKNVYKKSYLIDT